MSIVGFVILILLVLLGIWIYVKLAALPGQKAIERGHPQAEAINILGWFGLLLGIAPWLVALVWAYTVPSTSPISPARESADAANDNA
jgi:hypothetical protein